MALHSRVEPVGGVAAAARPGSLGPPATRWCHVATLALALCLSSPAFAGETYYQTFHVGERAAGLAGAFTALADEATGAFYNPAGLVDLPKGVALGLTISAYQLDLRSLGEQLSLGDQGGTLETRTFTSFPSGFGYVHSLGDKLRQALALTIVVPASDLASGDVFVRVPSLPDPQGGPPITNVSAGSSFRFKDQTFWFGASYAIRLHERVSLGASLFYLLRHFEAFESVTVQAEQGGVVGGQTSVSSLDAVHGSLRLDLGVKIKATRNLRIGLSFRSPSLRLHRGGDALFDSSDLLEPLPRTGNDLEIESKEPFRLSLGLAWEVPRRWALALDLRYHGAVGPYEALLGRALDGTVQPLPTFGGSLQRDAVLNVSIGGEYYVSPSLVLRGGFYTNFTSIPTLELTEKQSGQDRVNLYGLAAGFAWVTKRTTLSLTFNYAFGFGEVVGERSSPTSTTTYVAADATRQYFTILIGGAYNL